MQVKVSKAVADENGVESEGNVKSIGPIFTIFLTLHQRMKDEGDRHKRTLLFSKKRYQMKCVPIYECGY